MRSTYPDLRAEHACRPLYVEEGSRLSQGRRRDRGAGALANPDTDTESGEDETDGQHDWTDCLFAADDEQARC